MCAAIGQIRALYSRYGHGVVIFSQYIHFGLAPGQSRTLIGLVHGLFIFGFLQVAYFGFDGPRASVWYKLFLYLLRRQAV